MCRALRPRPIAPSRWRARSNLSIEMMRKSNLIRETHDTELQLFAKMLRLMVMRQHLATAVMVLAWGACFGWSGEGARL